MVGELVVHGLADGAFDDDAAALLFVFEFVEQVDVEHADWAPVDTLDAAIFGVNHAAFGRDWGEGQGKGFGCGWDG